VFAQLKAACKTANVEVPFLPAKALTAHETAAEVVIPRKVSLPSVR
jgi:hypothetical protein